MLTVTFASCNFLVDGQPARTKLTEIQRVYKVINIKKAKDAGSKAELGNQLNYISNNKNAPKVSQNAKEYLRTLQQDYKEPALVTRDNYKPQFKVIRRNRSSK